MSRDERMLSDSFLAPAARGDAGGGHVGLQAGAHMVAGCSTRGPWHIARYVLGAR